MRISDMLVMCFNNLMRRKSRTILTALGVLIGSISITLMISLSYGIEKTMFNQLETMADLRVITVSNNNLGGFFMMGFNNDNSSKSKKNKKEKKLNDEAIKELKSLDEDRIIDVVGVIETNVILKSGRYSNTAKLVGFDMSHIQNMKLPVEKGTNIDKTMENQILFGAEIIKGFRNDKSNRFEEIHLDPFKESFKLYINSLKNDKGKNKKPFRINPVGVIDKSVGYEKGYSIYMDIDDMNKILEKDFKNNPPSDTKDRVKIKRKLQSGEYDKIMVITRDVKDIKSVNNKIKALDYKTQSMADSMDEINKQLNTMRLILGGIGAVSLIVAAVGITNTMIMSVYERTREIGVMKVLGCEVSDILKMFLIESMMIGFVGGILGIILSNIASVNLNKLAPPGEIISIIPLWLYFASVFFTSMIGVVSGILPAFRASKLSALEAIKTNS